MFAFSNIIASANINVNITLLIIFNNYNNLLDVK